jgi:hypothetical protein
MKSIDAETLESDNRMIQLDFELFNDVRFPPSCPPKR